MKRLTHYNEKDKRYDIKNAYLEDLEQDLKYDGIAWLRIYEAYQELGKLEDIEEENGIDLITLFKAVMNGFWWKSPLGFHYVNNYEYVIDLEESRLIQLYEENSSIFYFEDYGKVWALTKEELKNGND